MNTITRQQFTDAIKAGLAAATTPEVKAVEPKLMKLARTATATRAFGFGFYRPVKCPLSAVGLYEPGRENIDWHFVRAFDDAAVRSLAEFPPGGVISIVG